MLTITITEGITLTASQSPIDTLLAEKRAAEVEAELRAWLADPANRQDPSYSDIFKDVHGFRPRW
jgi:hypothetical protein